jgi:uncharacterized protein DUF2255
MRAKRQFSDDILTALRESKGLRIRAGTGQHRFIGIWVVVVRGRVFIRSWSVKPNGWYRTFLKEPRGIIQVADRKIGVCAIGTRSMASEMPLIPPTCKPGSRCRRDRTGFSSYPAVCSRRRGRRRQFLKRKMVLRYPKHPSFTNS